MNDCKTRSGRACVDWRAVVCRSQRVPSPWGGGGRRTARAQTQSPGGRAIHRSGWGSTCSSGTGAQGRRARHRAVHHMGHHHRGLVRDADSGHADQLDAVRLERGGISHISHPHTWPLCIRYVRSVTLFTGNSPQISSGRSPPQARSL